MILCNIEFYSTPDGEVMVKECNQAVRKLEESDRDLILSFFIAIRDRYPVAFKRLSELYSKSEKNRLHFEYKIVHRFARCNFGEYDQQNYDIDRNGSFQFEEVRCPLRGECQDEGVVCKPSLDSKLSARELEILALIAEGLQATDIANELSISTATVNRHRENIKAKLCLKTLGQMVNYYLTNIKK